MNASLWNTSFFEEKNPWYYLENDYSMAIVFSVLKVLDYDIKCVLIQQK